MIVCGKPHVADCADQLVLKLELDNCLGGPLHKNHTLGPNINPAVTASPLTNFDRHQPDTQWNPCVGAFIVPSSEAA